MRPTQIFRIWVLALVLLAVAGAQAAGPWYVATNGADSNAGTSWAVPYLTISNALFNASASPSASNDTIWVSNGTYVITATVSNPAAKRCLIRAWSTNPVDTVLLGHGSNPAPDNLNFRGVWMSGAGSLLQGFTVTNFYYTNENTGAGVYCSAGLVSNCVITGNLMGWTAGGADGVAAYITAYGGGVYLLGAGVLENCDIIGNSIYPANYCNGGGGVFMSHSGRIRNCRIVGNRVSGSTCGGGVMGGYLADFIIQDSVIASNTAGSRGAGGIELAGGVISNCLVFENRSTTQGGINISAISGYEASIRIERCVISNNVGSWSGGGIVVNNSTNVLISQCTIVSNYCNTTGAGGLYMQKPSSNIRSRNCLVANNRARFESWCWGGGGGAGMNVAGANALIENCTIVSNTLVGGSGAGLYATNAVRVVNSIIYHNSGVTMSNFYDAAGNCTSSNSCIAPLPSLGTANTSANPLFVSKDTGNFRLNNNSPCINTGMNYEWMTGAVDLDGRKRIRYGTVDMGAYERIHSGTTYGFR